MTTQVPLKRVKQLPKAHTEPEHAAADVGMVDNGDQMVNPEAKLANMDQDASQDVDRVDPPVEVMPAVHAATEPKEHSYQNSVRLL